jgi:hypothetical protein
MRELRIRDTFPTDHHKAVSEQSLVCLRLKRQGGTPRLPSSVGQGAKVEGPRLYITLRR